MVNWRHTTQNHCCLKSYVRRIEIENVNMEISQFQNERRAYKVSFPLTSL